VRHVSPHDIRTPWIGVVFLAVALGACTLIERFYDRPMRRLLTAMLDRIAGWGFGHARRRPATSGALAAETRT
jgi:peptidoglycan/LPS O-acetylase OafA/YrhL